MKKLEPFLGAALFLGVVALLAVVISSFVGCDHGANIPIDPIDPCLIEGVEECCPNCEVCEVCPDPVVCPPPECFVEETEKVCIKWRHGWCCDWDKVVTFVPVDCPEVEVP